MRILLEVSAGELVDRICILELKANRLAPADRPRVAQQLARARARAAKILVGQQELDQLFDALRDVNAELWETEEKLRQLENAGDFGARFVTLARSVYHTNDRRAALKRKIDDVCQSELREHKSYALPQL